MPLSTFARRRAASINEAGAGVARVAERLNLTTTGLGAITLLIVAWFAARAVGSRAMFLMVYTAALTMGIAWLVTRRRPALTVVRSELPKRVRVGQAVAVELQINATRRVSTVMLDEQVPPEMGRSVRVPIGLLHAGQELAHRYTLLPSLRGVYQVGPVSATWSDPFGFTTHRDVLPEPAEIIVHPPTEVVHDRVLTRMWEDPPIRPPVSKPWPVGFEFYGMREYVPGDDLRRVVWQVLAKTGKMMVRDAEQGITDRVVMFIDNDREWHSPGERSETFETAIRTAASLGVRHLKDGFGLTLVTSEGKVVSGLRGQTADLGFLDTLARLEVAARPMENPLHLVLEEASSRPHVLIITPHLSPTASQQCKLLTDRGVGVVVAHVVWEESDYATQNRAVAVGARVVQIEPGVSLEAVFSRNAHARSGR